MGLLDFLRFFRRRGQPAELKCPVCGVVYPADVRFCPRDGAALADQRERYDAFVSYRRSGGGQTARLVRLMVERFSERRLFLDVDELGSGRFDDRLLEIIESTPCFILVLSPGSLDRCVQPDDWLRREILHALARNRNIVPVLVDGFTFPPSSFFGGLPPSLAALPNYQAVVYDHQYADSAVRKILRYMTVPLSASQSPADLKTDGTPRKMAPRATGAGSAQKAPLAVDKAPAAAASEVMASKRLIASPAADAPGFPESGLSERSSPVKVQQEASSLSVRTSVAAADAEILDLPVQRTSVPTPSSSARFLLGTANLAVLGSSEEKRASGARPPPLPGQLPSFGASGLTVTAQREGEAGGRAPIAPVGPTPRFLDASLALTSSRSHG